MSDLKSFFQTIHEHSLWQVLGTYLAGSWFALQVVETLNSTVGLPDWVGPGVFVLLAIGLPILMVTSFVQGGIGGGRGAGEAEATPTNRLFTWRRALAGGVMAFTALGVVTTVYLLMRSLGIGPVGTLVAQGVLDESATIVLADFAPGTSHDARAATEALRVDLSQSRVIRLADDVALSAALSRMGRDPADPLDKETAIEIAVREGFPGVIAGEINRAGIGYVFSAELLSQSGDEVLASRRVTARDSTEVLDAIDELSKQIRERIGESLARIEREPPLTQVTTSSLEALRKYSQGVFLGASGTNLARANALLDEATTLDTTFAMAWASRAINAINNGEERAFQVEGLERAFRYRDRLTERERYQIEQLYYTFVRDDLARAALALENLLEIDPNDSRGLANLGALYLELRRHEEAEELSLRALAIQPAGVVAAWNASEAQGRLGRFEEAEKTARDFLSSYPNPFSEVGIAYIRASQGEYDYADSVFVLLQGAHGDDPFWRALTSIDLASVAAVRGQIARATALLEEAARTQDERGLPREALRTLSWAALLEARVLDDPVAARARLDRTLASTPLSTLAPLDRPYVAFAEGLAVAGDVEAAKRMVEEMAQALSPEVVHGREYPQFKLAIESPDRAVAEIALAAGRHEDAIEAFRRSDFGSCALCALPGLARAYDAAGRADSARAVYERFLGTPEPFRLASGDALFRGLVLERLARLYDEQGHTAQARAYYQEFVELWAEADQALQPRVDAARARLIEIR